MCAERDEGFDSVRIAEIILRRDRIIDILRERFGAAGARLLSFCVLGMTGLIARVCCSYTFSLSQRCLHLLI